MTYDFAALRFTGDSNISDRTYWYLTDIPLKAGERVLAPVGLHDRLQAATVERVLTADERDAPYDLRLIKEVTAPLGARKLVIGETSYFEWGGVKYDEKHYTPFGRLLLCKEMSEKTEELSVYGVTEFLPAEPENAYLYANIARASGCVLLFGGEGAQVFEILLGFVRGANKRLYDIGVNGQTMELLRKKLL